MAQVGAVLDQLPLLDDLIKEMSTRYDQSTIDKRGLIESHLASSMGTLSADARKMDSHMKVWIGATIEYLNKYHKAGTLSWDTVIESLMHNPVLEPMDDGIFRKDMISFGKSTSWFNFDGTPSPDDPKVQ